MNELLFLGTYTWDLSQILFGQEFQKAAIVHQSKMMIPIL